MVLIKTLAVRDIRRGLNLKLICIWILLSLFGIFFFFTSRGYTDLKKGYLDYMAIMLPQIIFGAWAILTVFFDLLAQDRDTHVLDCILCSGIKKRDILLGKFVSICVLAIICTFIYLVPISIVVAVAGNDINWIIKVMLYVIPLWGYIVIYGSLGMLISILARSTKMSLIMNLAFGLIMMPRFFVLITEGLAKAFHLPDSVELLLEQISPGILMSNMVEYSNYGELCKGTVIFIIEILVVWLISVKVFARQDELSY